MAHEITMTEEGTPEMAFIGARKEIWHGLGQQMEEGQSIDTWKKAAGMNWEAMESAVSFNAFGQDLIVPDRKVLFRSDNKKAMGIVGADYHVVQPGEVLQFFDDLTKVNGMKLSTAGTLFEGRKFWALAELGKKADIGKGDEVNGFLLLTTSLDGSVSTQARFTSTRVVCNNTLNVALRENSKSVIRVTHKKKFDPKEVKMDLGLIDTSWNTFITNLQALKTIPMNENATRDFYQKIFFDASKKEEDQPLGNIRAVDSCLNLAFHGAGAEMTAGTALGALQGVTERYTHWNGDKTDASIRFWDSYVGHKADRKTDVFNRLMELV